eukprot:CAMPEP_0173056446 /NCGR_PEP_ID=MMETSP1102-20130122/138_1 /TAXON_ID=49646 /ORGANISM="Geminigera sp., Strain Caron Lab Isolate" /LENGTH=256 /DNA_ID=CAMNT_0013921749 /DNA_START=175 /DNA_END=945 /DNA_ORIENTATION=+
MKQALIAIHQRPFTAVRITDYSLSNGHGSEREAQYYAAHNRESWRKVEGALTWLTQARLTMLNRLPSQPQLVTALNKHRLLVVVRDCTSKLPRNLVCTRNPGKMPVRERPPMHEGIVESFSSLIIAYEDSRSTPSTWPSNSAAEWGGWCTFDYEDIIELPFYDFLTRYLPERTARDPVPATAPSKPTRDSIRGSGPETASLKTLPYFSGFNVRSPKAAQLTHYVTLQSPRIMNQVYESYSDRLSPFSRHHASSKTT